jgi:hypothetical protein
VACDTHKSQKLAFKTVMVTAITIILSRPPLAALDHKVGSVWVLAKRSPHAGILEGLFCGEGPTHLVAIVPLLVTGSGTHCSLERDSKSNLLDRGGCVQRYNRW